MTRARVCASSTTSRSGRPATMKRVRSVIVVPSTGTGTSRKDCGNGALSTFTGSCGRSSSADTAIHGRRATAGRKRSSGRLALERGEVLGHGRRALEDEVRRRSCLGAADAQGDVARGRRRTLEAGEGSTAGYREVRQGKGEGLGVGRSLGSGFARAFAPPRSTLPSDRAALRSLEANRPRAFRCLGRRAPWVRQEAGGGATGSSPSGFMGDCRWPDQPSEAGSR